jgi:hypothetical protein
MKELTIITLLCILIVATISYDPTRYDSGCVRFQAGRYQVFLFRCWYASTWKLDADSFVFPFGVISWR